MRNFFHSWQQGIICFLFFFLGCKQAETPQVNRIPELHTSSAWFRQAVVDLGAHIQMLTPQTGFASSRGRGQEVPGHIYQFQKGKWIPILSYPYSDFPLIQVKDSASILLVHHLIHTGYCRPLMKRWQNGKLSDIQLPKIMWDQTDYVMFKGIAQTDEKHTWLVGQQGNILYFDGDKCSKIPNPLSPVKRTNMYEGDLNDICMVTSSLGWAVGRDGNILKWNGKNWESFASPTHNDLVKVNCPDENHGWIVGDKGTLLTLNGNEWHLTPSGTQERLTSVKAIDSLHAWIVGLGTTLIKFNGTRWEIDESIKTYNDVFSDIDVKKDALGNYLIWIIGNNGIYTNSQSLGFSFTDITSQSSLRRSGRGGIFFSRGDKKLDILALGDGGSHLLFSRTKENVYSDITLDANFSGNLREPLATTLGDVNNDGLLDILELESFGNFRMMMGRSNGSFRDNSSHAALQSLPFPDATAQALRFVDLDNDGNLDLYFSNHDQPDMMYRNNGTGSFTHIIDSTGVTKLLKHRSFGATFGDFNNDGLVDIFIPYYIGENGKFFDLFFNQGNFHFTPSTDPVFITDENISPTVGVAADFNNDGNLDIIIHHQSSPPWILLNNGHGYFTKVTSLIGFTEPVFQPDPSNGIMAVGDVNNDGWQDVFIASRLFINQEGKKFVDITEQSGIQFTGQPTFADADDDGDVDLFIGSSENALGKGDRAALFRNNINNENSIKIRVQGDISNRSGIGTKVYLEDPLNSSNKQLRVVGLGSSPMIIQDVSEVHFGVIPGKTYSIRVEFQSGMVQTLEDVHAGERLEIYESSFLPRIAIRTIKSLERTTILLNWTLELLKLLIALSIIVLLILLGRQTGARKLTQHWVFPISSLTLYLILLHLTITEGQLTSSIISFGGVVFGGGISIAIARTIIRKREARYISHFKLLDVLGHGGMGRVYKALDVNTKQIVALKILNPEIVKDVDNKKRLLNEGQLLSSITHPYIVKIYEVADAAATGFIAMEYLPGGTVKQTLESSYPLPLIEIKRILLQVCEGLKEVHSHNIIHRDLKTGNLMFDSDRNIRIMDFGLSKSPLVTTMTSLGTVLGTLGYVAPEQITNQNVDHRTDIFSLGVIIYELLTNTLPFKGENEIALIHSIFNVAPPAPSQIRSNATPDWDALISKCIAKNIDERFQTVEQVKEAISRL